MQIHASCAARYGQGVLVLGPSGSGKSSLILAMVGSGYMLVADDQVIVEEGMARCPAALAGLLEIRGVGIVRLPHLRRARLRMTVKLEAGDRMPDPAVCLDRTLPMIRVVHGGSALARVDWAMAALCDWPPQ